MKKATFKVTSQTTKAQLLEVLTTNMQNTEGVDQQTVETAAYAIKNPEKATRTDLVTLVKTFMTALGDKFIVPAFVEIKSKTEAKTEKTEAPKPENLVKKTTGSKSDTTKGAPKTNKAETKAEEEKNPPDEGADGSPKPKKKGAVKKSDVIMASASNFPETITIGDKPFNIVHGEVTMEDLNRDDVEYEFCFWWTKRHLKQFPYFSGKLPAPVEFPYNLDCTQLIYVSDEGKVAYTVSDITEAPYTILPGDLEEVDGIRISNSSIEYAIYSAPVDTEETTEDEETTEEETTENEAE